MKRELRRLSENEYDLLVIGGGIFGLFITWDAALRGLSVALVDKSDFGSGTSSNSLRIIHGGFRHLRSFDLRNARRYIREQAVFMKMAPHLVRPMPVVIPVYGNQFLRKGSLAAAVRVYNLLGSGLTGTISTDGVKFENRVLSSDECMKFIPGLEQSDLRGGIVFTDCQISNSERFTLEVAASACDEGADLANYLEVVGLLKDDTGVKGAKVKDNLTGDNFDIRARFIVNASGPWINGLLNRIGNYVSVRGHGISRAFNLLVDRQLTDGYALGLRRRIKNRDTAGLLSRNSRYLFITPWNSGSLIGTEHLTSSSDPDNFHITDDELISFLNEINESYPYASLKKENVAFVYGGHIPTNIDGNGHAGIENKNCILDHGQERGMKGLISVIGIKFTDARIVAEKTIDTVLRKMGKDHRPSKTDSTVLSCSGYGQLEHYINEEIKKNDPELNPSSTRKLIHAYGSSYREVLKSADPGPENDLTRFDERSVIKAQTVYAVKEEMARKLSDVVFRRTDLGLNPSNIRDNLDEYAKIMGEELGWDDVRIKEEKKEVFSKLNAFHLI